jgi:hypothetical protein
MCKKTISEPDDNIVAIHSYYRCLGVNSTHKRAADKAEETAERVPEHVVAVGRENSVVSDDGEDYKHDQMEETDAGFEGGVVAGELEEGRDHVYGDEDCGSACVAVMTKRMIIVLDFKNSTGKTRRLVVVKMA